MWKGAGCIALRSMALYKCERALGVSLFEAWPYKCERALGVSLFEAWPYKCERALGVSLFEAWPYINVKGRWVYRSSKHGPINVKGRWVYRSSKLGCRKSPAVNLELSNSSRFRQEDVGPEVAEAVQKEHDWTFWKRCTLPPSGNGILNAGYTGGDVELLFAESF